MHISGWESAKSHCLSLCRLLANEKIYVCPRFPNILYPISWIFCSEPIDLDHLELHVIVFYAFGFTSIGFFFSNIICHRQSLYYLHPYVSNNNRLFNHTIQIQGRLSYYIKISVTILYLMSVPVLLGSFMLYWKKCILWGLMLSLILLNINWFRLRTVCTVWIHWCRIELCLSWMCLFGHQIQGRILC
jgi:hypothetical protein